jgi:hypothetical protein
MEEEFVTYEQALALNELGFDDKCLSRYCAVTEWEELTGEILFQNIDCNLLERFIVKAPLKQQVFRWFREKYEIHGFIIHYSRVMFRWCIDSGDDFEESIKLDTYEEAENDCIDKLIEIAKLQ